MTRRCEGGNVLDLIKVWGHPRSGNGLMMEYMARAFYPVEDLATRPGRAGHWADRRPSVMHRLGKLAGGHAFSPLRVVRDGGPVRFSGPAWAIEGLPGAVYVYRDGRDVMASLWRTKAFMHPKARKLSFSEWLRRPLDWLESPAHRAIPTLYAPAHWRIHVDGWAETAGAFRVRYEDMVRCPEFPIRAIWAWADSLILHDFEPVEGLVGTFPNEGRIGAWRDVFSDDDLAFFGRFVPTDHWALFEGDEKEEDQCSI